MAGAILEGLSSVAGSLVTRNIYIVDSGDASGVKLYVYKKTDTVTSNPDTTTIILASTINLPLTGGSTAHDFMAANFAVGTTQAVIPTAAQANTAQFVPRTGYRLKSNTQSLVK